MNDQINLLSIKYFKKRSDKVDLVLKKLYSTNVVKQDHNWKYHKNLHDCELHT